MGGGRRHFNIWVAYSDLFSNLATFLFISAIGIFAAIGSGAFGPGTGRACALSKQVAAALSSGGSVMTPADSLFAPSEQGEGCSRFYRAGDYRFRSADLLSFTGRNGLRVPLSEIRDRICRPVWAALGSKAFKGGRINFITIAGSQSPEAAPTICGSTSSVEPPIIGFPSRPPHAKVINQCLSAPGPGPFKVCAAVRPCLHKPFRDRDTQCRQIWAAHTGVQQSNAACGRELAALQAKRIYDQCAGLSEEQQGDQMFATSRMLSQAGRPDGRRDLWQQVYFEARPPKVAPGNGSSQPGPGTVFVELKAPVAQD